MHRAPLRAIRAEEESPATCHGPRFKRILLKLSGEALMGAEPFGIDPATVARVAGEVKAAKDAGLRALPGHRRRQHLPRHGRRRQGHGPGDQADYMGMLATVMNALADAERARAARRRHPRAVGDPDGERSANRTSAAAPSGIWKRAGS